MHLTLILGEHERKSAKKAPEVYRSTARLCDPWSNSFVQLKEALAQAIARLTAEDVPSPRMNAELLLMFTLNCDRAYLFAHPERELAAEDQSLYDQSLAQRLKG